MWNNLRPHGCLCQGRLPGVSGGRAGTLGAISRSEVQSQINSGQFVGVYYGSRAFGYLAPTSGMLCAMFRLMQLGPSERVQRLKSIDATSAHVGDKPVLYRTLRDPFTSEGHPSLVLDSVKPSP